MQNVFAGVSRSITNEPCSFNRAAGTTADAEQIANHLAVCAISFARCFLFPGYLLDKGLGGEKYCLVSVNINFVR
ncbi:aminotransferase class I and II [Alicyclobacillus hesperidum URH17-3-68]|nr:aminotransferase class I and II [Alicyclobacillus hesperidum URH17-3-68]